MKNTKSQALINKISYKPQHYKEAYSVPSLNSWYRHMKTHIYQSDQRFSSRVK